MKRALLATTAALAIFSTGALAQDTGTDPMNDQGYSIFSQPGDAVAPEPQGGFLTSYEGQVLAGSLIGHEVYATATADASLIGNVNDVVLSPDGNAEAIVIGVGGFLGIGEKEVAIDFDRVSWVERDDGLWLTTDATREELESAPAFDRATIETAMLRQDMTPGQGGNPIVDAAPEPTDESMDLAATDDADGSSDVEETGNPDESIDVAATETQDDDTVTGSVQTDDAAGEFVDVSTLSAEELIGTRVYGSDDEDLGEIGDVVLTGEGEVEAYIVDVGGFLGIGEKPVALDATELKIARAEDGALNIRTQFTAEQLEQHQAYTPDAYAQSRDEILLR